MMLQPPATDPPAPTPATPTPATGPGERPALRLVRSALPEELRDRVASAREVAGGQRRRRGRPPLPTGLALLDRLLGGGLPRGRLVELFGRTSRGRFSTVLELLAAVTRGGETAALVDLGDGLDAAAAAAAGVDLERLLWVRPRHLAEALSAAEILLAGDLPAVLLELGSPPVPGGRGAEGAWQRLSRAARERDAILVVASPYRATGTAAATVLAAGVARPRWHGAQPGSRLLLGLEAWWARHKHAGAAPGDAGRLPLVAPSPWAAAVAAAETTSDTAAEPAPRRHARAGR